MTTYCIVDDEPIAHRIIEGYCSELPHFQKTGNAYNVLEATSLLHNQKTDLIFLDINMPKITGFEWLKTLSNPPMIIVTTAHEEFALEGYELNILDYLLKPFSFQRFLKAINKINDLGNIPITTVDKTTSSPKSTFFLKGDKKHHQIHINDILYIEAFGNYSKVYLMNEMILSHEKISNLETLLSEDHFLRVHKSFIVAIDKIKYIQGNTIGIHTFKIPIGQTYKNKVQQMIKSTGFNPGKQ